MRTTVFIVLGLAALTAALLWVLPLAHYPPPSPPVIIHSQGPTIERLERLSHLVTARVYIADVLIGEGKGCRGAWLIRGDALIAVDMSKAAVIAKDEQAKTATIRLLLPEILQARVDHGRTRTWQVQTTTWIPWTSDQDSLRDTVMRQAQELVAHAAASAENLQQAKTTAETMIRSFYAEVGWQVRVTWASPPSEAQKVASSPQ
ncbi:MAG: DUF4230 domain-containing protein [Planctomycetota bacterium]